jgi:hypothetical protein
VPKPTLCLVFTTLKLEHFVCGLLIASVLAVVRRLDRPLPLPNPDKGESR